MIDATFACIRDVGFHATTTRKVGEVAGLSLGAIAHHFPSRIELISATLEDVAGRAGSELLADVRAVSADARQGLPSVLDRLWVFFTGDLFVVWIRSWLTAAEDPELRAALAPVEERLAEVLASVTATALPDGASPQLWSRRFGLALDTMRGAALTRLLAPSRRWSADHWSATREELLLILRG